MYNLGIILFTALIGCVPTTPEESAVQVCNSPLEEARLPLQEKGFVVEFGVNKTIDNVLVIKLRPHDPMPPVDLLRDSFRVPVGLILENRRSSGTELKSISKAPNLVSITFSRTELSASILEQLSSFKKLRHLKIDECVISGFSAHPVINFS